MSTERDSHQTAPASAGPRTEPFGPLDRVRRARGGVGASRVRDLFKQAREAAAVYRVDFMDALEQLILGSPRLLRELMASSHG